MAWKTKRSIAIVAMQEWSLHPAPQRRTYKRSGTIATAVAAVVERAAKATH